MTGRVIVVGSVNVDLVARVERLPAAGETVVGAAFERHPGGKGANQATAAARVGARVEFVGAVGDDALAGEARAALLAEGVGVTELATLPGPTGVALIFVDRHGENAIAVASGANGALSTETVIGALDRLGVVPGDVILVSNEIPTTATAAALRAGRGAGATTILNPSPARGLDRRILDWADVVVPNRGELSDLDRADDRVTGRTVATSQANDPVAQAKRLLESSSEGPGIHGSIVVTLGAAGALIVGRDDPPLGIGAPRVVAVDTVGAGDTFVGVLAADLAAGSGRNPDPVASSDSLTGVGPAVVSGLERAVRRAVVAAALATTKLGARTGMPTPAELDEALARGS
jgi:ribokinase